MNVTSSPALQPDSAQAQGDLSFVPMRNIRIVYNPRRHFDKKALEDLVADIKIRGVMQPLLIRPDQENPGMFLLVAGERRLRAGMEALGEDSTIPAFIRDMTDAEAVAAATAENEVREATSETEQADAAVKHLELCGGDKAETARRLGWSQTKLERRLALSKLSPKCKEALDTRQILVGHAELLAAIPPDKQDVALERIIERKISVSQTKEMLDRTSNQIATAIFDTTDCASCQYNATLQRNLFDTTACDGACTNPGCYQLKTETVLKARQAQAEAEAAAEADDDANITLTSAVSTAPDTDTDTTEDTPPTTTTQTSEEADEAPVSAPSTKNTPKTAKTHANTAADTVSDDAATHQQMISRSSALRETVWRRALAKHLAVTPEDAGKILILAAYTGALGQTDAQQMRDISKSLISSDFGGTSVSIRKRMDIIESMTSKKKETAISCIAGGFVSHCNDFQIVRTACDMFNVDIRPIWCVDKAFLETFTKKDLKLLALDCEFVAAFGEKKFAKLMTEKRSEIITAMLSFPDFSWSGRLPRCMTLTGKYEGPITKTEQKTDNQNTPVDTQAQQTSNTQSAA